MLHVKYCQIQLKKLDCTKTNQQSSHNESNDHRVRAIGIPRINNVQINKRKCIATQYQCRIPRRVIPLIVSVSKINLPGRYNRRSVNLQPLEKLRNN